MMSVKKSCGDKNPLETCNLYRVWVEIALKITFYVCTYVFKQKLVTKNVNNVKLNLSTYHFLCNITVCFCPLQFLCLKNIRTFLASCCDVFGMKKSDLFEAFDLFDVRDFGKVARISVIMVF